MMEKISDGKSTETDSENCCGSAAIGQAVSPSQHGLGAGGRSASRSDGYHRRSAVAQVNPAPKPLSRITSPRFTRPSRTDSFRARGMLADEVLP